MRNPPGEYVDIAHDIDHRGLAEHECPHGRVPDLAGLLDTDADAAKTLRDPGEIEWLGRPHVSPAPTWVAVVDGLVDCDLLA